MKLLFFFKIAIIFLVLACKKESLEKNDSAKLNYGDPPENYEKTFTDSVKADLKDPDSAKFQNILKPKMTWYKFLDTKVMRHGWAICGEVSEKYSSGKYLGFDPHLVMYLNGKAKHVDMTEDAPKNVKFGQYDIFMLLTSGDWPRALFQTKDGEALCPGLESFKK